MPCPPPDSDLSTLVKVTFDEVQRYGLTDSALVVLTDYKECWKDVRARHGDYLTVKYDKLTFYVTPADANGRGMDTDPAPPGGRRGRKTRRKTLRKRK